jgi:hypothetical protein
MRWRDRSGQAARRAADREADRLVRLYVETGALK